MTKTFIVRVPDDFSPVIDKTLSILPASGTFVLALQGDLGAGKTTFTQQLAKRLGVSEPITSPTFTIMKRYPITHEQFDSLVHIDAYRFETESEAIPVRLDEVFREPRSIVCVEWPENIRSLLPTQAVWITIDIHKDQTRHVQVR